MLHIPALDTGLNRGLLNLSQNLLILSHNSKSSDYRPFYVHTLAHSAIIASASRSTTTSPAQQPVDSPSHHNNLAVAPTKTSLPYPWARITLLSTFCGCDRRQQGCYGGSAHAARLLFRRRHSKE